MKSMRKAAELKQLRQLCRFVRQELEKRQLSPDVAMQMELVINEICANIIYYAYPKGGGDIEVKVDWEGESKFVVEIVDNGIPFNPKAHIEKQYAAEIEEVKESSYGLLLSEGNVDEISYSRIGEENHTRVIKYLVAQSEY